MTIDKLKDILEIIYFLSGPVIAYLAFRALGQINEAKKQVLEAKETRIINSKRDAYKIAAEKCEYYMTTIIPLINNLDRAVKENNITFFEKSAVVIDAEGVKVKPEYKCNPPFFRTCCKANLNLEYSIFINTKSCGLW